MISSALSGHRRVLIALALAACLGLVCLALPAPSQAQLGRCGNEFDYYSDDTYTDQVGMRYWDCPPWCTYSAWGRTSPYVIVYDLGCS